MELNSSQKKGHCQICVALRALLSPEEPLSTAQRVWGDSHCEWGQEGDPQVGCLCQVSREWLEIFVRTPELVLDMTQPLSDG